MSWSRPGLGVGVIVTTGLDLLWEGIGDLVDVVEVEPQTMWRPRPDGGWDLLEPAFRWVEDLGIPALVHGIGFPVGGCEPPDPAAVALTARCAARLGAAHWSEHLSFTRVRRDGCDLDVGFLLPPAQTPAGVALAATHVAAYQRAADLPFLVETGVNYLRPRAGDLPDGAFIAGVAERADCGILLDLHNLLTNERNGRQPVDAVLAALPLDRVLEVHVAGGFELAGYYLDAHVGGPDEELLELTGRVLPTLPNVRAVLFEAVPESLVTLGVPGVRAVLTGLHRICERPRPHTAGPQYRDPADGSPANGGAGGPSAGLDAPPVPAGPAAEPDEADLTATWEREQALAAYTAQVPGGRPGEDPGYDLLRLLASEARRGELMLARPEVLGRLLAALGRDAVQQLLDDYLVACPPRRWLEQEGTQFTSWLVTARPDLLPLAGLAAVRDATPRT